MGYDENTARIRHEKCIQSFGKKLYRDVLEKARRNTVIINLKDSADIWIGSSGSGGGQWQAVCTGK